MESKITFPFSRCCSVLAPPSASPDSHLNELAISFASNDSSAFTEIETTEHGSYRCIHRIKRLLQHLRGIILLLTLGQSEVEEFIVLHE